MIRITNSFVRGGFRFSGLGRINPSVNAPNLRNPPTLGDQELVRDDSVWDKKPSATGWIMFTRTLDTYGLRYSLNGTLQIHDEHSWLTMNRLWILTIGLLGRYGYRFDRGRARGVPTEARIDHQDVELEIKNILYGVTGSFHFIRIHTS